LTALGSDAPIEQRVCVVFAHPDDETVALGAQLPRLRDLRLVVVTDGAPRNLADAVSHGFSCAADYAAARRDELLHVLALAGIDEGRLRMFAIPDQESAFRLPEIAKALAEFFRAERPEIVITHCFEGGHPDHDATAFAVHCACAMAAEADRPELLEAPLYRAGGTGWIRQRFEPLLAAREELVIRLGDRERALKRRMLATYRTQSATLDGFGVETERFRSAPEYDFTKLPNGGELLYERYSWGLTGPRWQTLACQALDALFEGVAR
jgi:LmbE family N-acetylglucosaminyl deacetylase